MPPSFSNATAKTPPPGARVARAAAPAATGAAQRRHPADDIELAARDLEQLARDMRETGRSRPCSHDLEEEARRIAGDVVAVFRGTAAAAAFGRGAR